MILTLKNKSLIGCDTGNNNFDYKIFNTWLEKILII